MVPGVAVLDLATLSFRVKRLEMSDLIDSYRWVFSCEHGADLVEGGMFCAGNISELQKESNAALPLSGYVSLKKKLLGII